MNSSSDPNGDPWLLSVIAAYQSLVAQWSALSTMIRSARPDGLRVCLRGSDTGPTLLVYQVPPLSLRPVVSTETFTDGTDYVYVTSESSSTDQTYQATSVAVVPPRWPAATPPTATPAPSPTSKPATCPSARTNSGRSGGSMKASKTSRSGANRTSASACAKRSRGRSAGTATRRA